MAAPARANQWPRVSAGQSGRLAEHRRVPTAMQRWIRERKGQWIQQWTPRQRKKGSGIVFLVSLGQGRRSRKILCTRTGGSHICHVRRKGWQWHESKNRRAA